MDNIGEGIWKLTIFRRFKGKYSNRIIKWICCTCLIEAIEGYHTGGGIQPYEIKKIRQRKI